MTQKAAQKNRTSQGGRFSCVEKAAQEKRPSRVISIGNNKIVFYKEISSTNSAARKMALSGQPDRTVVMASYQTEGAGRMNRGWICPPGRGIMISLILWPDLDIRLIQGLTLLCSVAVVDAIEDVTDCTGGIKWPNDVLIGGKKVCGILAQCGNASNNKRYVIMGAGLNVNQTVAELPGDCKDTSTSLLIESGKRVSRMRILKSFLHFWDTHYSCYLAEGFGYLREAWIDRNVTLGRMITTSGNMSGIAKDISQDGGIIIEMADGTLQEFQSEELSLGSSFYRISDESV